MRRLVIALLAAAAALGSVAFLGSDDPAAASTPATSEPSAAGGALSGADLAPVDVFEVSGIVDEIVVDEIGKAIDRAATDGAQALILQLNSKRAVVSREKMASLASAIRASAVPVAVWVGPSGARGYGLPGQLVGVAAVSGVAPGARIGNFGEPLVVDGEALSFGGNADRLATTTSGYLEARREGAISLPEGAPDALVLRDMVRALDGLEYRGTTLHTIVEVVGAGDNLESNATTPRFFKLGLVPRLFHTVASPPVAYLLFVVGAALLVFEFFTAGVGVAGVTGAVGIVLGSYGLGVLPVRGWALALVILSILALAIDVQVGVPRFWTGVGMLAFTFGSVVLYRDGIHLSWITLVVAIAGMAVAFALGMPAMIRSRFATPVIDRGWLVGETGRVVSGLAPEGIVEVRGATWRACSAGAATIAAGEVVGVVAVDGVTLDVERAPATPPT